MFATLKDFDLKNKRVLLRVDINLPIEPRTMKILDDTRIMRIIPTLKSLDNARTVLLAHQSRPGKKDFTTLKKHAKRIEQIIGRDVQYISDVFGATAEKDIKKLKNGDILVLENVRFCSEEVSETVKSMPPEEQANTHLVRRLSSYCDFYVNDAFAVCHRNQPSVVAFPEVLPCCAGKLLEREVKMLSKVLKSNGTSKAFILGGAKAGSSLDVIKNVLEKDTATVVLTSGLIGNIFLIAKGFHIGDENRKILSERRYDSLIQEAKNVLDRYGDKIKVPLDLAYQKNGSRIECPVEKFPDNKILDIGIDTIASYVSIINDSKIVVANGPCGVFEKEGFELGSYEILKAMARSKAFTVIGGGHLSVIAQKINLTNDISYISTGGKATMSFLAGEKLPGIEALINNRGKKYD